MLHRLMKPRFTDSRNETIWLTVYADLITNLALVFLALFGLTMLGDEAIRKALLSMKMEDWKTVKETTVLDDFEKITFDLQETFKDFPDINVVEKAAMARIEFGENVLFKSGSAHMQVTASPILMQVANLLRDVPFTIVVEGHTDSVPVKSGGIYKNNWELSLARSMAVTRILVTEGNISPDHLAAAAYGPHRAKTTNLTTAGRLRNRRVEIALLKDFPYVKKEADK